MIQRITLIAFLWMISSVAAWSQCVPSNFQNLDGNQVRTRLYNGADMFWDLIQSPLYEVPRSQDSANAQYSVSTGGLWMGGRDTSGGLHVAAELYRVSGNDYSAGPFRARNFPYECDSILSVPAIPDFETGMMLHSSGKNLIFYNGSHSVYDPVNFTQVQLFHHLPKAEYGHVELPDGRVLLFGDDIGSFPNPSVSMFLKSTTFSSITGPTLHYFHRYSRALLLSNGKVLISGIMGSELFDATTNTTDTILPPANNRHSHAMVELQDGRILISGGTTRSLNANFGDNSTELYDPATGTWSAGPNMSIDRLRHSMTVLPSGKVLIFGGGRQTTGQVVELFDPVTDSLYSVGALSYPAGNTIAIPLSNGNIYLSYQENTYDIPIAELYDPSSNSSTQINYVHVGPIAAPEANGYILTQFGSDSSSGFHRYDPETNSILGQRWQRIWKVSKAEINTFISDQFNGTIDWRRYPDIRDWPAHGDTARGEDFHLAPFIDVNQDGLYQPAIAGDYPCILGDQALWWVFNDVARPHTKTGGPSIGVQIEAMAYAYDCQQSNCPDSALDYTTFYHYEILNKSALKYEDFHLGYWLEGDYGIYTDDFMGCDTALDLAYFYNADSLDEALYGYGFNPPATGMLTLNTPDSLGMTAFIYMIPDFSTSGYPENDHDFYGFLRGFFKDSTHLVNNGLDGHSRTGPGPETNFVFPGDPGCDSTGQGSGWTEISAGRIPFARKFICSTGPSTFEPGDTIQYDFAMIWARNADSTQITRGHIASVCELKMDAPQVRNFWLNQQKVCFNQIVGLKPRIQDSGLQLSLYPNPNRGSFTLEGEVGKKGAYRVYDLYGRELESGVLLDKKRFEGYPRGVYLIEARYGAQRITKKVLVQ